MDLTLAAGKADVHVWVGAELCNVTLVSPSQIACEPPSTQPAGTDIHGNPDSKVLPLVVVRAPVCWVRGCWCEGVCVVGGCEGVSLCWVCVCDSVCGCVCWVGGWVGVVVSVCVTVCV